MKLWKKRSKGCSTTEKYPFNEQVYITNVRHKEALEQTLDSLKMVKQSVSDGMPEDFYSIDLMNAYEQLGKILGEAVEDDLVNEIFSKFCMGSSHGEYRNRKELRNAIFWKKHMILW